MVEEIREKAAVAAAKELMENIMIYSSKYSLERSWYGPKPVKIVVKT